MAVASVSTPIAPPRASISRTICPLATPPMAGLQLIWPTVSQFIVKQRGPQPHPRGGQGGLEPGVAGPDDDHVEMRKAMRDIAASPGPSDLEPAIGGSSHRADRLQ